MNRTCNGDYFTAAGNRYYRCLKDHAVMFANEVVNLKCPNCKRRIESTTDLGVLDICVVTILSAVGNDVGGGEILIPLKDSRMRSWGAKT